MFNLFIEKKHPEEKADEVFLTNVGADDDVFDDVGFHAIGWKTKRQGITAYDTDGKPVPDAIPVFVQRSEMKKDGIDPDKLWPKKLNYKVIFFWSGLVIVILISIAFAIIKYL